MPGIAPGKTGSFTARLLGGAVLAMFALPAMAQSGAVSNFDRDGRPDLAVATTVLSGRHHSLYSVEVLRTGSSSTSAFDVFASVGGINLSSRDVDGDHDLDLVVRTLAGDRVGVWLNDGSGQFSPGIADQYPAWIWDDLPEFAVPGKDRPHDSGVAISDDQPGLSSELPRCGDELRTAVVPGVRFLTPRSSAGVRNFIRPPPSPLHP